MNNHAFFSSKKELEDVLQEETSFYEKEFSSFIGYSHDHPEK